MLLREPLSVLTGGPGCGKSTTLRVLLDRLDERAPEVDAKGNELARYLLAAPTGKAARRMQEATGRDASTIHRLLEYGPGFGGLGFQRHAKNPIEASLVVVDEASMVDVRLAEALLDAIDPETTRLAFVGDANQLPSVGPGRVLSDFVESESIPVARLTTLHRAAAESWVCRAAPRMLAGETPDLEAAPDFHFFEVEEAAEAARVTLELATSGAYGPVPPQVLTPQRPHVIGVTALNRAIQAKVNPARPGEATARRGEGRDAFELRMRDRVLQTRNDYQRGVFNGEVGNVVAIGPKAVTVDFDGRAIDFDAMAVRGLDLAYALTIHKSQGSEWPWVIVVCHSAHTFMLSRQLVYTAVTRAKKGVLLVGDKKGLASALKNVAPSQRFTTLAERLRAPESTEAPAPASAGGVA